MRIVSANPRVAMFLMAAGIAPGHILNPSTSTSPPLIRSVDSDAAFARAQDKRQRKAARRALNQRRS